MQQIFWGCNSICEVWLHARCSFKIIEQNVDKELFKVTDQRIHTQQKVG